MRILDSDRHGRRGENHRNRGARACHAVENTPMDTIGFIGLGLMGKPMAANLLARGYPVVAHNRSRGPVDELATHGARPAVSPAEVARQATRIITMLPDSPDVEQVLEGSDGVFSAVH